MFTFIQPSNIAISLAMCIAATSDSIADNIWMWQSDRSCHTPFSLELYHMPGVPLLLSISGVAFPSTESLTETKTWRQPQDPTSRNSPHTRMLTRPGNQTITNHHLAHCQTYRKPPYASMQSIIYKICQSPYPSRKPRCLKCVYIYAYLQNCPDCGCVILLKYISQD